jgi:uncharacterized circularly permuted ATP-grasp superfamily protein/uncharacterized alpha-E superfamily protein
VSSEPASKAFPGLDALYASYSAPAGHYDELRADDGAPRAHWQRFAEHARRASAHDLYLKEARVGRQIHENGVTYNVYAGDQGSTRPWSLDVLPMILPAPDWDVLAQGLRQRARLLNAMAGDFYGGQRLLAEGLVPPALVLGHPGFLRACHGIRPANGVFLHQVAFDLLRGPDGRWWVEGHRTQAPSGAGYALENRITISRLFPEAFRAMRVHRLAEFFRGLQHTLLETAPCAGERPHVVLLTPGPYNETYFEHSYLARYLGFTLVEGGDLTVRDDRVYLKTLKGLERVHAILRRLDDDFCDPLELRSDSTLGVPGLVQAWRAGEVLIANAFGTSVLESPALLGFLPGAAQALLGEELQVPSVATWWCGEAAALRDARPRLSDMVVRPTFPDLRLEPVVAAELDDAQRAGWLERLEAAPDRYVLQEYVASSQVPAWHDGRLESRALMLRVFLVSDGRGDYSVMPGGLSRIAGGARPLMSRPQGGSSKDTWVLSDAPVETFSMLPGRLRPEDIARSQRVTSSRAGENLFWLGRYAERSENGARLMRAVLSRLLASDDVSPSLLRTLVQTCRSYELLGTTSQDDDAYADDPQRLERDLLESLADATKTGTLAFNIAQTVRVASGVRDRLSTDNWRLVSQLSRELDDDAGAAPGLADALDRLDRTIVWLLAIGGLEVEHMTRNLGWRFLSLGRHLERLLYVTTTVAAVNASDAAEQPALLEWLLDLSDSIITYRTRYVRMPEWLPVTDLLLFDPRNPRSAAFQLGQLSKQVRRLPESELADLDADIDALWQACMAAKAPAGGRPPTTASLSAFLEPCAALAPRLSDALALRYFSHVYEGAMAVV